MPKITNPVVINKIRQGILEGKPSNKVLIGAGLSKDYANKRSKDCKILKVVKGRIEQELKAKDITVDYLVNSQLHSKHLAASLPKPDLTNYNRSDELLSRLAGIDKPTTNIINVYQVEQGLTAEKLTERARQRKS